MNKGGRNPTRRTAFYQRGARSRKLAQEAGGRRPDFRPYRIRNQTLCDMGFASYDEYLRSPLWRSIRSRVLHRDRRLCLCGQAAKRVHHLDYEKQTLMGCRLTGMVSVCQSCHQAAEVGNGGRKRSLSEANSFLRPVRKAKCKGGVDVNEQAYRRELYENRQHDHQAGLVKSAGIMGKRRAKT